MSPPSSDFQDFQLREGIALHLRDTDLFKTIRIDIFIQALLQPKRHTCVALISRLLQRGTRQLPDLPSLNRFVDQLYGADFAVDVGRMGERQVIHLSLELVDESYLPAQEPLLPRGMALLHDVLRDPVCEGNGFPPDYLSQEKRALKLSIDTLFNDKSLYAQRRCFEALCQGEPGALSALGESLDFDGITPVGLLQFYWKLLACNPFDVFVCGRLTDRNMVSRWADFFDWERHYRPLLAGAPRRIAKRDSQPQRWGECQEVSQGRLVLGYRTCTGFMEPDYAALVLFSLLWGGDHNSRLFRVVREAQGLCYHIAAHLDPLCKVLLVGAGIEEGDCDLVIDQIAAQLEVVRAGKFDSEELETARVLLLNRLLMLDEDREDLVWFYYRQQIAGQFASRELFGRQLAAVSAAAVSRVAGKIKLEKIFFLHRGPV